MWHFCDPPPKGGPGEALKHYLVRHCGVEAGPKFRLEIPRSSASLFLKIRFEEGEISTFTIGKRHDSTRCQLR